jgi:acyl-coenzyme A synthetase/AMP-(fatty) acid ligase/acyl carrier protein
MYTSGSTGKPKGVMITHRNVGSFFAAMDRVLGPDRGVWLAVTSISFDISVLELFWTLARGFTVVIHSEEPNRSIFDLILEHGVTHFQCTPSLASNLVHTRGAAQALPQLRKLLVGGEALPAALAAQLLLNLRGELFNMYGPTETTVWSASHPVREVNGSVPIGRPIANTQIHILDEHLHLATDSEPGELYIGGEGVARGYFNRPELTAERFVADPFNPHPKARLYRTGDIGRRRGDGAIEFLGRADHQIKLHGHRIELGEIEGVLSQHPSVRECVVHIWEAGPDDRRLAAYIVPANAAATAQSLDLRRFLEAKLPGHMIPAAFVWLEKMPLTPNGKVDRKALPTPNPARPSLDAAYAPPKPGVEKRIADIWQEILRVETVGVNDNFFDLGGNSLLLMQTHARLCAALSVELPIVRFFEYPTIAALTQFLASREQSSLGGILQRAVNQRAAFARQKRQLMPV